MKDLITRKECQTNIKNLTDKIDDLTRKFNDFNIAFAKFPETIIEKLNGRYAEKKVEKVVYGLIGLILTSVVIAILALVIKNG